MIKYRWVILSLLLFATTINYKLPENHKKVDQEELAYIKSDQDFSPASAENKISHLQLIKHRETWAVVVGKLLADPIWWFYIFWGASFLNKKFGINIDQYAKIQEIILRLPETGIIPELFGLITYKKTSGKHAQNPDVSES
ncbi:MAG: hypothetical protein V5A51_07595 [Bacteroidales bacterium]|nr:hypothetical protein [Bacteroidales bacterium]